MNEALMINDFHHKLNQKGPSKRFYYPPLKTDFDT